MFRPSNELFPIEFRSNLSYLQNSVLEIDFGIPAISPGKSNLASPVLCDSRSLTVISLVR